MTRRRYSGPIKRVDLPRKSPNKYTEEENQWLLDLHAARPDLGWADLSRRFCRQWGKDRPTTSVRDYIKKKEASS